MPSQTAVRKMTGRGIPLPGADIDTDRIIPARFMKAVTFEGLGEHVFHDARFDAAGHPVDHPFNDPRYTGARILLVGRNFGCGSSREHAPQALMRYGIRAMVGESFAEIFAGNCAAIGLPAVRVAPEATRMLVDLVTANPAMELAVDLEGKSVQAGGKAFPLEMPESARRALVEGAWDSTSVLLANRDAITGTASRLPYLKGF